MKKSLSLIAFAFLMVTQFALANCRIDTIYYYVGSPKTISARLINSYDNKDSMILRLEQKWENNSWINQKLTTRTFNQAGKMLSYIEQMHNPTNNQWVNHIKSELAYTNNFLTERAEFNWSATSNSWVETKKWNYANNSAGFPTQITYLSQGTNASRTNLEYDASNNITTEINQTFTNNNWVNSAKKDFTYNAANQLTSETPSIWNTQSSNWVPNGQQFTNVYDANGNLQQRITAGWDNTSSRWVGFQRTTYTRSTNGITQILNEQYYGVTFGWKGVNRERWNYNGANLTEKFYENMNSQIEEYEPNMKEEFSYNNNDLLSSKTKLDWITQGPGGFFRPAEREQFTYHSNNKINTHTYLSINQAGFLEPVNERTYEYNANNQLSALEIKSRFNGSVFLQINREEYICGQCQATGLKFTDKANKLKIYPNPANHLVTIETEFNNAQIQIVDLMGKLVYSQQQADVMTQISTEQLNNGIYLVKINHGTETITQRLVIDK